MKITNFCCLAATVALTAACSADWNDHYNSSTAAEENLMELIAADGELSEFSQLLKATGYDKVLAGEQTYTVWAPKQGGAALLTADADVQLRTVRNHIARYTFPTSTSPETRITLLNGKTVAYDAADSFEGIHLTTGNIAAQNGLLHKMDGMLTYRYNLREYIDTHEECQKMSRFLTQFDEKKYSEELSTSYDSVFVNYNALLNHVKYGVGDIANEDSTSTMVIADDAAWQSAYDRLAPAFMHFATDQAAADSIQRVQTEQTIFRALTSRELKPEALGHYSEEEASNGAIFLAQGVIADIDTCLTHRVLVVEAEDMDGRASLSGTNAYIRNTDINSAVQQIGNSSYLEVSSGNVDGGVTFDVPNVLAQTYDVYVDFVSPIIDGEALSEQKTKVTFQLRYMNAQGKTSVSNNNTATQIDATGDGIISVKAFSAVAFPVADFYDELWRSVEGHSLSDNAVSTTLQVKTKVTSTDARNGYERIFRIDRIRFVPVTK